MKEEHKCPIDGCESTFFTEVGLSFHVKGKHGTQPKIEAKPAPKKEKPMPKKAKVTKEEPNKETKEKRLSVTEYEKKTKEKSSKLWKDRLKAMRKSMATVKVGDKLTKKDLVKLVGDSQGISHGKEPVKLFSSGLKKQKFTITKVMKKENDWKIFYAESPSQRVVWKEGPVKNKHFVTIPTIVER